MATAHGSMGTFDPEEDWYSYVERLEQYCEANGIENAEKKRATLLSCCGPKTYGLIRGLVAPDKSKDKSFQ